MQIGEIEVRTWAPVRHQKRRPARSCVPLVEAATEAGIPEGASRGGWPRILHLGAHGPLLLFDPAQCAAMARAPHQNFRHGFTKVSCCGQAFGEGAMFVQHDCNHIIQPRMLVFFFVHKTQNNTHKFYFVFAFPWRQWCITFHLLWFQSVSVAFGFFLSVWKKMGLCRILLRMMLK